MPFAAAALHVVLVLVLLVMGATKAANAQQVAGVPTAMETLAERLDPSPIDIIHATRQLIARKLGEKYNAQVQEQYTQL